MRLKCPGYTKKGGGQRVKSLFFFDSWNAQAGGSEQSATYGKKYDGPDANYYRYSVFKNNTATIKSTNAA